MVSRFLVDSSIWVAHLRGSAHISEPLIELVDRGDVVTCEPIVMELLAGAKAETVDRLERMLDALPQVDIDSHLDFRVAAQLMRRARGRGNAIRSSIDALIGAIALRIGDVTILHDDIDFERIATIAPVSVERWSSA
jgi:predicted nucleic acid-binding protein